MDFYNHVNIHVSLCIFVFHMYVFAYVFYICKSLCTFFLSVIWNKTDRVQRLYSVIKLYYILSLAKWSYSKTRGHCATKHIHKDLFHKSLLTNVFLYSLRSRNSKTYDSYICTQILSFTQMNEFLFFQLQMY